MSELNEAERPPSRLLGMTLLLGSLTMFGPMSIDMYLPALPAIAHGLATDSAGGQLTLAAFLAGLAFGQLIYGPISDRVGRRPPLIAGILVFIVMSVGCALATSIEMLIGLRFLQALGAGTGLVIARAVVMDIFPRTEAARMFSLLVLVLGVAPILAPILGGWVLIAWNWRAIFLVLAAFGAIILAVSVLRLAESRPEATALRARSESVTRAYIAVLLSRKIVGYGLAGAFGGACFFTFIAASPDLFIHAFGVAPENYGWIFGPLAVGFVTCSQINRHLIGRVTVHALLRGGLGVAMLAATALVIFAATGLGGFPALVGALFVLLSSLGFVMPNGVAGAMAVDLERSGTSAAVVGSLQFLAGATAAAAVSIVHDGTALPMAINIAILTSLAMASLIGLVGRSDQDQAKT